MPVRGGVVIGQQVDPVKAELARKYRRQMTPAESALWRSLRANRLKGLHFRRQQIIDGFIVDFYCHAAGLVVEVDGPIHERKADYDAERDRVLTAGGLRVMRVTNEQVMSDLTAVLKAIAAATGNLSPDPFPAREGELLPAAPVPKLPSPARRGAEGEVSPDPFPTREEELIPRNRAHELPSPRRGGIEGEVSPLPQAITTQEAR